MRGGRGGFEGGVWALKKALENKTKRSLNDLVNRFFALRGYLLTISLEGPKIEKG